MVGKGEQFQKRIIDFNCDVSSLALLGGMVTTTWKSYMIQFKAGCAISDKVLVGNTSNTPGFILEE